MKVETLNPEYYCKVCKYEDEPDRHYLIAKKSTENSLTPSTHIQIFENGNQTFEIHLSDLLAPNAIIGLMRSGFVI